jgi:hypothetical protein
MGITSLFFFFFYPDEFAVNVKDASSAVHTALQDLLSYPRLTF